MKDRVKVILYGLVPDPVSKTPVMVLKPEKEDKLFPIWIGGNEANTISMEMEKIHSPRPMTHDLIRDIIGTFNGSIEKVVISGMKESTFFAELHIKSGNDIKIIDCRPSDGITLALKYNSNIYIDKNIYLDYAHSDRRTAFFNNNSEFVNWFPNEDADEKE